MSRKTESARQALSRTATYQIAADSSERPRQDLPQIQTEDELRDWWLTQQAIDGTLMQLVEWTLSWNGGAGGASLSDRERDELERDQLTLQRHAIRRLRTRRLPLPPRSMRTNVRGARMGHLRARARRFRSRRPRLRTRARSPGSSDSDSEPEHSLAREASGRAIPAPIGTCRHCLGTLFTGAPAHVIAGPDEIELAHIACALHALTEDR